LLALIVKQRDVVIGLIKKVGIDAFDAGMIQNAVVVENHDGCFDCHKHSLQIKGAGIHMIGVPRN
jgi:predicted dinucleotide-binding enzyme